MTPPASTEPMYLISESEMKEYSRLLADDHSGSFALVSKVEALAKKYEDGFRARGPVQQAPCGSNPGECLIKMNKQVAQAREHVLDELAQMYANVPEQFLEGTYRLHSEWKEKIESLRHGQKQEREPE